MSYAPSKSPVSTAKDVTLRALSSGPRHHFFGYFDKCPWGPSPKTESLVLAHETDLYDRVPGERDEVAVGYLDTATSTEFVPLATSRTWNLQQGAMLQWLPGAERTILYNDRDGDRAVACLLDLETKQTRRLERPVAALSHDGRTALSVSFGRLARTRPDYGYVGVTDPVQENPCPRDDGIWSLDIETGASHLLLSTHDVATFGPNGDPPGATHWINHLLFNRDDSRFCFLHRYENQAGTMYTRLLTCGRDGSNPLLLVAGMASHFDWRTSNELVAWAGERKLLQSSVHGAARSLPIGKILKFTYRALGKPRFLKRRVLGDRYILFNDPDGTRQDVGRGVLTCDGHCRFSPDGRWMLADTYPDTRGRISLLLFEWSTGKATEIAKFFSPPKLDNEIRCDLHPRWGRDGRKICVDSAHDGSRQMIELDVSRLVDRQ